jgi:hypothetical protein
VFQLTEEIHDGFGEVAFSGMAHTGSFSKSGDLSILCRTADGEIDTAADFF